MFRAKNASDSYTDIRSSGSGADGTPGGYPGCRPRSNEERSNQEAYGSAMPMYWV